MNYSCPVCGFDRLEEAPYDEKGCASFEICPCCGTEFGYHDAKTTHEQLRARWSSSGGRWHSKSLTPPKGWSSEKQIEKASGILDEASHDPSG